MVRVGNDTPLFRPAGNSRPIVEKYRTDLHKWRQEDTWEALSKKYLLTERYAEALRAYNMQDAQVSERVRQEGRAAPGDDVIIPPGWVLEQRHGTLIRPAEPAGAGAAPRTP